MRRGTSRSFRSRLANTLPSFAPATIEELGLARRGSGKGIRESGLATLLNEFSTGRADRVDVSHCPCTQLRTAGSRLARSCDGDTRRDILLAVKHAATIFLPSC